jgi:hypothetical protein
MVQVAEEVFFRHHRVVLALMRGSNDKVASSVSIFTSSHWNAGSDKTIVALASQGHDALSLMKIGSRTARRLSLNGLYIIYLNL